MLCVLAYISKGKASSKCELNVELREPSEILLPHIRLRRRGLDVLLER